MSEDEQAKPYPPMLFLVDELHLISSVTFPIDEIARVFSVRTEDLDFISTVAIPHDDPEAKLAEEQDRLWRLVMQSAKN